MATNSNRRRFLQASTAGAICLVCPEVGQSGERVQVESLLGGENLIEYIHRVRGGWDETLYRQLLGTANPFKEGDAIVGVAAGDEASRVRARELLGRTRLADIQSHSPYRDRLSEFIDRYVDPQPLENSSLRTLEDLKRFLLHESEAAIHSLKNGLSSDMIACLVKLMTNEELTAVSAKVSNILPGSQIGAHGYLGARIQPNSPTDNVDDIRWQVLDGFAYAVGDVLLGTNPVSSNPQSVLAVELALRDILTTFGLTDAMPHCVLTHIDVQAEVERQVPDSTALWFQSIAGNDAANATFDLSIEKMVDYARRRDGTFGLYFETGQGADFTNGHAHGCDMVLWESRKYGFARALTRVMEAERGQPAWVHVNDVAGFIGPEVFRTREQLVRCCLEDLVMGKLHGLTIGLDVCSTLHMDVTLHDLDWCLDQIAPAQPAYLMALPTKIDPMLGYLTTGYQDHVRLREKFGYRVNDRMWKFFQQIEIIDATGRPTQHFGDPLWVYQQYCRLKGDRRTSEAIVAEARKQLSEVRGRGLFIAEGFGTRPSSLAPQLENEIERIYSDAKDCIWREWDEVFLRDIPKAEHVRTQSVDRSDYILHPESGERLTADSQNKVLSLRAAHAGQYDVQFVVSEGLNALALMDKGHLMPLLDATRAAAAELGYRVAPEPLVVTSGRVRAGYRIGELLFGALPGARTILHIIGERPGSGHHTMSVYMTRADGSLWQVADKVDHNITRVVSGIATTALSPSLAAQEIQRILKKLG